MRIVICDDERQYADFVEAAIEKWKASRKVTSIYVSKFQSSEDVCEGIGQSLPYDVAFLDIQFPGEMDGLKLAQMLKAQSEFMTLILMTNYQEYAIEGYRVNALRFLTKPLSESAIWECLDIAHHQWTLMNDRSLMIKTSQQVMRIPYRSIIFAESMAHYAVIRQTDGENITARMKLSQLAEELPGDMFMQCHRCYLVNLLHVYSISRSFIRLSNGGEIPVSPKLWAEAHRRFREFYQGGGYGV